LITTEKGHELQFPFLAEIGVVAWRLVTLDNRRPYVFISYASKEGRCWLSQTSVFSRHEDVVDFCKNVKGTKSRKILNISILFPSQQDGVESWSWVPVKEIFSGEYKDSGLDFPLYVDINGEKIGGLNFVPHKTTDALERIFPTANRRSKPKQAG
jgi:hypothetical protein